MLKMTIFSLGQGMIAAKPSKNRSKIAERNACCDIRLRRIVTLLKSMASVTKFTIR